MSAPYTPAFPTASMDNRGMSLRDYFATAAMQTILADPTGAIGSYDAAARHAYAAADAMLQARQT